MGPGAETDAACVTACFPKKEVADMDTVCGAAFVSAVDSIIDVYTVSQLKQKAQESPEVFFGITYSFISKLDLDSSVSKVIKTRW